MKYNNTNNNLSQNNGSVQANGESKKVEPWGEEVDGNELFRELTSTFDKYLVLNDFQSEALALWCIFSHSFNASNIAPKLLIHSPEKRCGKTTLLDVLSGLVRDPIPASNITPAALFRVIDKIGGTIMIDEADTFLKNNAELNGIINSGHRRSTAFIYRCVGDAHYPTKFSTWAPTVIAMIDKPQDTIIDRSIVISMRRKKENETVQRFSPFKADSELKTLCSKIVRWVDDNFEALCDADPEVPEGLNDRAEDNWRSLISIADLIGGECPRVSRLAAQMLSKASDDDEDFSPAVRLLTDIRDVFENHCQHDGLPTADLLRELYDIEEAPWAEWNRGKEITARQLAKHLRPFGITPKKFRHYNRPIRGYKREDFADTFDRYLSGTTEQISENSTLGDVVGGTRSARVPEREKVKSLINNECSVVPDDAKIPVPKKYRIRIDDDSSYDGFFDED